MKGKRGRMMTERGRLIVISGPSGAGKSTVVFKAIEGRNDFCFSTSVTTRAPRPGEQDGREYFFVDRQRYDQMVENDELLEHAEYVGNGYGTPRAYVDQKLAEGMNVVLDIEVQGARQVKTKRPDAVMIFVIPPSMEELHAGGHRGPPRPRPAGVRGGGDLRLSHRQRRRGRGRVGIQGHRDGRAPADEGPSAPAQIISKYPHIADEMEKKNYDALSPCCRTC